MGQHLNVVFLLSWSTLKWLGFRKITFQKKENDRDFLGGGIRGAGHFYAMDKVEIIYNDS